MRKRKELLGVRNWKNKKKKVKKESKVPTPQDGYRESKEIFFENGIAVISYLNWNKGPR